MEKRRIYIYDNLKAVLIILVVLGHILEPFIANEVFERGIYIFIYSFHMAVFVYCAGVFSSFNLKRDSITLLLPYLVFQTAYILFSKYVLGEKIVKPFIKPYWLMWFLACLFVWRFVGSILERCGKKSYMGFLCVCVCASLLEGFTPKIGYDFSLSRFIYFLPFFLLGWGQRHYNLTDKIIMYAKKPYFIILSGLIVLCYIFFVVLNVNTMNYGQLYFTSPYGKDSFNILLRACSMLFSVIMSIFLLGVLPDSKTFLSDIGQKTICVYLFHGFVLRLLSKYEVYKLPIPRALYVCIFLVLIVFILSRDFVKKAYEILLFQKTFKKK